MRGIEKRNKIGDLILPIAAIRGEGTSNDYFPAEVPALPAFALQKQFQLRYEIVALITGQALYIPRTVAYGNMMMHSNNT